MTLESLTPFANHVWQSTLFAVAAGLLTLAFRRNHARVRYWLWLSASLKFLVPFSLLVGLGSQVHWRSLPTQPRFYQSVEQISQPFALPAPAFIPPAAAPTVQIAIALLLGIWLTGVAVRTGLWLRQWLRVRQTLRIASRAPLNLPVPVLSAPSRLEPGIFGILQPVLLLPEGIADRLTPSQFRAILAHELCHVRRRDNLTAALHVLVETIFWFHPLVWWLWSRLVEERERACDEEVLRLTGTPEDYAEGLLNVCRFYLESPLVCASGVTGADLKLRIRQIMQPASARSLTAGRKLLLSAAAAAAIAVPIVIGVASAPPARAQAQTQPHAPLSFEVTSVKPNPTMDPHIFLGFESTPAGRLTIHNSTVFFMITSAYGIPFQSPRISGGPEWIRSERFDIDAKAPEGSVAGLTEKERHAKMALMLQSLLADRFQLVMAHDIKELPIYAVTLGKGPLKLKKASIEEKDCTAVDPGKDINCHIINGGMGRGLHSKAVDLDDIVLFVENWSDRPIVNKTGLTGLYEIDTEGWAPMVQRGPDANPNENLGDSTRPTLAMIFDRLGLKLEQQKGPVEKYTIEHVEHPTGN
jgi:bla regulator protein blaR1